MGDRPEKSFRAGNVSASVFINQFEKDGRVIDIANVSLQRSYRKDGEWKQTTNLSANDIPKAILVLNKAYEYSFARKAKDTQDTEGIDETVPESGTDTTPF